MSQASKSAYPEPPFHSLTTPRQIGGLPDVVTMDVDTGCPAIWTDRRGLSAHHHYLESVLIDHIGGDGQTSSGGKQSGQS
jgi:hypothetical protein